MLVDVGSIEELMQGGNLRRAEGDQDRPDRDTIIKFDVFNTELTKVDKKDAELLGNHVDEKELATGSSPTRPPPPSASTLLPSPQRKVVDWFADSRTHRAGHGQPPPCGGAAAQTREASPIVMDERASAAI